MDFLKLTTNLLGITISGIKTWESGYRDLESAPKKLKHSQNGKGQISAPVIFRAPLNNSGVRINERDILLPFTVSFNGNIWWTIMQIPQPPYWCWWHSDTKNISDTTQIPQTALLYPCRLPSRLLWTLGNHSSVYYFVILSFKGCAELFKK